MTGLQNAHLVSAVARVLAATALAPRQLVLEITEGTLIRDELTMGERLRALSEMGVRIAIDDFGTGYSSLGYLSAFPFDVLKVDKAFVGGDGAGLPAITRAIVQIGQALELETIAEGIETTEQLEQLQRLGCRLGQGYLFARPEDAASMTARLEALAGRGKAGKVPRRLALQPETVTA